MKRKGLGYTVGHTIGMNTAEKAVSNYTHVSNFQLTQNKPVQGRPQVVHEG